MDHRRGTEHGNLEEGGTATNLKADHITHRSEQGGRFILTVLGLQGDMKSSKA